jgi:hypothetical protein
MVPPRFDDLNTYYQSYWKYLQEKDLLQALEKQTTVTVQFLSDIPPDVADYSYGQGKWKVKEIVGHLSDTERILSYRALRFSRNDKTDLRGFDENSYMANSNFGKRDMNDILSEWKSVRAASSTFFNSLTEEMADRKGVANNVTVSARIILYFIIVHERHHLNVIKERYLAALQH